MTQPTVDKARAALDDFLSQYRQEKRKQLVNDLVSAVLDEAADEAERENADCPVTTAGRPCPPCAARTAVAAHLRRMAEEARS